ncbi:MAG TPA: hypothetical protein V6C99_06400, partial [Oculatellaceae cyanobacterium]
ETYSLGIKTEALISAPRKLGMPSAESVFGIKLIQALVRDAGCRSDTKGIVRKALQQLHEQTRDFKTALKDNE